MILIIKAKIMAKIAFICYPRSSFVKQDYKSLSKHFKVEKVDYNSAKDAARMIGPIWRSNIMLSWFASGHSFAAVMLCKILGRRSVVIAGGYDVAFEPKINYGQYTLSWHKKIHADFVLKNADIILAVSEFTQTEVLSRAKPKNVMVLYNGVDVDKFRSKGEKENLVITVASGSGNVIALKGLNAFLGAASQLPEVEFLVLGLSKEDRDKLEAKSTENVELCGYVSHEELVSFYQRARVYCQLSYRESFGVALAEAMACGCVPVVTDRGALPEVVGDTGFYVPYGDEKATAEGIKNALRSERGAIARKRIEDMFSLREREKGLMESIEKLYLSK